jgi:ABC-type multidrug transport system fused ATPase/permease subunit
MASELDIISDEDLEAPLKLAKNYEHLANEFDALAASTTLLVNKINSQDASIQELTGQTKQLEKEIKRMEKANKEAAKSAKSMAAATELADEATGGFISKAKQLGVQLWALVANPIGLTLAAIAVALAAVGTYFRSTNEGADKFEIIMNNLKGVLDFLTNKFADLGEQIVKLFEDGNVVGEAFMFVFDRVINIIAGVIDSFTSLLSIINILSKYNIKDIFTGNLKPEDLKALRTEFIQLGKAGIQAMTGIGDASKEAAAGIKTITELTKAAQQLGDDTRNNILDKAEAELEIEKLLFAAKDKSNKTDQQRLGALKQAVSLSQDQLKVELDLAQRRERIFTAELLKSKSIITNNEEANAVLRQGTTILQDQRLEAKASDEELEQRKKLQADVINLQRNFFAENKKAIGQIGALEKEIADERRKRAIEEDEFQHKKRIRQVEDEIAAGKEIVSLGDQLTRDSLAEKDTLHKNFNQRLLDDAKANAEKQKAIDKKRTEDIAEEEAKRRLIRETAIVAVGMIGDEIFARKQEQLAIEFTESENRRKQELAGAEGDERKKLAINRKFDREQAKIKTKQAQADKQAAIFGIIINTALGIMKASPVVPLMIATGILGAIQLALVASKPIPKFATGTMNSPSTFIAGEAGRELVTRNGRGMVVEGATLFSGMEGSRVLSNKDTEEILGNSSDLGPAISYGSRIRRHHTENNRLVEMVYDGNKWLKKIASKPDTGLIIDEEGFHQYSNRVARRNERINRRFKGL